MVVEADSSCCHFTSGSGMFTPLMGVESSDTHTCIHVHTRLSAVYTPCRDNGHLTMIITSPPLI